MEIEQLAEEMIAQAERTPHYADKQFLCPEECWRRIKFCKDQKNYSFVYTKNFIAGHTIYQLSICCENLQSMRSGDWEGQAIPQEIIDRSHAVFFKGQSPMEITQDVHEQMRAAGEEPNPTQRQWVVMGGKTLH